MENKRKIGEQYEEISCEFLKRHGYEILQRNFYTRYGEIDIIAKEGNYLVFVEVKYRKNDVMGDPLLAINWKKRKHMLLSAKEYLYRNRYSEFTPCRFDAVSICNNKIKVIKNIMGNV